jgi:hypothetical protein
METNTFALKFEKTDPGVIEAVLNALILTGVVKKSEPTRWEQNLNWVRDLETSRKPEQPGVYIYIKDGKIDGWDRCPLFVSGATNRDPYDKYGPVLDVLNLDRTHTISFDGEKEIKISHASFVALREGLKVGE